MGQDTGHFLILKGWGFVVCIGGKFAAADKALWCKSPDGGKRGLHLLPDGGGNREYDKILATAGGPDSRGLVELQRS
ncbi:MAG: hypothetical protein CM15mP125_0510 [Gammaproteobacteria bacterium]|nr:MAG: hypothetical protein CM15mP125_0510 [Gammaproteobacteria bacterium]